MSATNAINDTGLKYLYDVIDSEKQSKEQGKGLSTNDYNDTEKGKVAQIANKLNTSVFVHSTDVEDTTTATKVHAKDSKFYLASTSQYCMATVDIAIGDTLVENTNYVEITIHGFLTDMEFYLKLAGQVLDTKVDKVAGKGLSTEDYTTAEKQKLASIPVWTVNETTHKIVLSEYADGNDISY